MTPRIHCAEEPDVYEALRGGEQPMHTEKMCDRFNEELRAGHGFRNAGDE